MQCYGVTGSAMQARGLRSGYVECMGGKGQCMQCYGR